MQTCPKRILLPLLALSLLFGIVVARSLSAETDQAPKRLVKQGKMLEESSMECQPINYQGRRLLLLYYHLSKSLSHPLAYEDWPRHNYLYFKDLDTRKRTKAFAAAHGFPSAIVRGKQMNVFATFDTKDDWTQDVYRFWSDDLVNWKRELVIQRDGDEHLFNTSVCQDDQGYVMTYESNQPQQWCWKFARSKDLSHWEKLDGLVFLGYPKHPNAGNPIIRYAKPYYYVIFGYGPVPENHGWLTGIARSKDLIQWEMSAQNPILEAPRDGDEGCNNTDADIAEFNGKTHIFYATGNQSTWAEIREAIYPGPMKEYFESCFPEGVETVKFSAQQGPIGRRPAINEKKTATSWDSIIELPEGVTKLDDGSTDVIAYSRPTQQQLNTQNRQLGAFCHFGLPTWAKTREEYRSVFCYEPGMPDSSRFDPKKLDAEQWVLTAKAFGAKWFVFTTKHHDGFCLWPTKTTDFSVKNVPWKNGQGDVIAEVAAACRKHNMPLGLYCSPADKHHKCFSSNYKFDGKGGHSRTLVGDPDTYIKIYKEQLREILTNYGPLCEVWLDGYLDPFGSDVTDPKTGKPLGNRYCDELDELIRSLQPDALIYHQHARTGGIRWALNEEGYADYPLWNVVYPGQGTGYWLSPDATGWFVCEANIHPRPDWICWVGCKDQMATSDRLLEAYYKSIGNGANLLINLTPYTDGLIPENETRVLHELGEKIEARFGKPLGSTDSTTGGWAAPGILELPLSGPTAIDHIRLVEEIALGQHVLEYDLEVSNGQDWRKVAEGQSIGRMHLHRFDSPVTAEKIRLRIRKANAIPTIREFTAFGKSK